MIKTLGLSALALLLIWALASGSLAVQPRYLGGRTPAVAEPLHARQTADRPRALLGRQRPAGDGAGSITLRDGERARGLPWGGGTDHKLRIIEPPQGVDCKIVCIRPDPNVDYKLRILDPGGHDVSGAPRMNRRKTIIIDPKRGGRK